MSICKVHSIHMQGSTNLCLCHDICGYDGVSSPAVIEERRKAHKETTLSKDLVTEEQAKRYTTVTLTLPDWEEVVDSDVFQTHATIVSIFLGFLTLVGLGVTYPKVAIITLLALAVCAAFGCFYFLVWLMVTDGGYSPIRWWPKKDGRPFRPEKNT